MRPLLISISLLLAFGCGSNAEKEGDDHQFTYEAVFTSGLDKNGRPADSIEEISIEKERIYFYIAWKHLSNKEYKLKTKVYDGDGDLVFSQPHSFRPYADGLYNSWIWYSFNKFVDTPGYWRFDVHVDGKKVFEKQLKVLPGG
jgi:hypothetical protein